MEHVTDAMRSQGYRTRLAILRAASAPRAVVLRRGPKKHWRLSLWDLETDAFAHGQWMKGEIRLSSLSPNGRRLLYWARQLHTSAPWRRESVSADGFDPLAQPSAKPLRAGRRVPRYMRRVAALAVRPLEGTWTALSRPPFFTALATWPAYGPMSGGGWFVDDDTIWINEPTGFRRMRASVSPPRGVRVLGPDGLDMSRWPTPRRPFSSDEDTLRTAWRAAADAYAPSPLDHVYPRDDGALDVATDGRIWRIEEWREREHAALAADARLIADFNGARFSLMPPSEDALTW